MDNEESHSSFLDVGIRLPSRVGGNRTYYDPATTWDPTSVPIPSHFNPVGSPRMLRSDRRLMYPANDSASPASLGHWAGGRVV
jgi:hypothetical protein